ncbi:MAG: trypsin-like peptidase domain-containing protein [Blastocatellia bacterium]
MFTRQFKFRYAITMAVAIVIASATLSAFPVHRQTNKKGMRVSPDSRSRVRKAIASVGLILVRNFGDNASARPRGSGVIVRSDGIIITNNHVITDRRTNSPYDEIFFAPSGDGVGAAQSKLSRLKTLSVDKEYDLALLGIEPEKTVSKPPLFPAVEIGDSKAVQLLDEIVIIGFPEKGGTTVTISEGVIEGKDILGNWIKTDARVIHGNSGGAAVDAEGKLIGIPTKVEADDQEIDNNGDGFPDAKRRYGAVGFLRPAHLVATMIARLADKDTTLRSGTGSQTGGVSIKGIVRSSNGGKPIAGALVGIVPFGTVDVTESNLLTWGTANADGVYRLNRPVPPGKYTLKAKALGHAPYSRDVDVKQTSGEFVIEMIASLIR